MRGRKRARTGAASACSRAGGAADGIHDEGEDNAVPKLDIEAVALAGGCRKFSELLSENRIISSVFFFRSLFLVSCPSFR